MNIFISYNWHFAKEIDFIEGVLLSYGLQVLRDKKELKYKDNIPLFMRRIADSNYALFFLSDKYFKSDACWFELLEFYKKPEFERKALPIIDNKFSFSSNEYRIELIEYWQEKRNKLLQKKKKLGDLFPQSLEIKIDQYSSIIDKFDDIIVFFSTSNYQKYSEFEKGNGKTMLDFLGIPVFESQKTLIEIQKIQEPELKKILLEKFIKQSPNLPYGHFVLGNTYLKEEKFKRSLIHYQNALANRGKGISILHSNMGIATLQLIDFDKKALNEFTKQELKFIDNAILSFKLANCLSENSGYHMNLGIAYSKINKPKASFHFNRAIELEPENRDIYYNMAKLETEPYKRIELYTKCIEIDTQFSEAFCNRGKIYQSLNKKNDAINDFTQCIILDFEVFPSYFQRGRCYLDIGEFEKGDKDFSYLIKNDNMKLPETFYNRALCKFSLNHYEKAINDLSFCIMLSNDKFDIAAHYKRGDCYLKNKDYPKAMKDFDSVLKVAPFHFDSLFYKGGILYHDGQYQDARECYKKIIDNNGNIPEAKRCLIECERRLTLGE